MEYWLHITTLGKSSICLKLAQDNNVCFDGKYLVKKINLEIPTSESSEIIFDVNIRQGKSPSSTIIDNQRIILRKSKSLLQLIDNIICCFSPKQNINVDLMISKTNKGVNIGLMSPKYDATHIEIALFGEGSNTTTVTMTSNKIGSREVFTNNLESFVTAIEKTFINSDVNSEIQDQEWINAISSVSNSEALMAVYNTCEKDMKLWKNIIESWGVKFDKCSKYPYCAINKEFYSIPTDASKDSVLKVIKPSCTIWLEDNNGNKKEKLIIKGQVQICQN